VCDLTSDSSRDNSQSSTDTASFSGSTQGSCPPSAEKIKLEPMDVVENGIFIFILLCCLYLSEIINWCLQSTNFSCERKITLLYSEG